MSPYKKQIYVVKGLLYDFWYKPDSNETFECVVSPGESVLVPEKAMHGFYALEDVDMVYLMAGEYCADQDKTFSWLSPELPFTYDFPRESVILSEKDDAAPFFAQYDYVLLGASGFLGSCTSVILRRMGKSFLPLNARLEDTKEIADVIRKSGCKYVICAAGISGRPTTKWCEEHEKETFEVNYLDILTLMKLTDRLGVHLTIYGSGLLYQPTAAPRTGITETDKPDLLTSVYSRYRIELESHLHMYQHVLCLRILYPVTGDGNPKCFLSKMIERASCVHNTSVSITVVPDLFPTIPKLIEGGVVGPLNFVNSGTVTLPELLHLFGIEHKLDSGDPKPGVTFSTEKLADCLQSKICGVKEALTHLSHLAQRSH